MCGHQEPFAKQSLASNNINDIMQQGHGKTFKTERGEGGPKSPKLSWCYLKTAQWAPCQKLEKCVKLVLKVCFL